MFLFLLLLERACPCLNISAHTGIPVSHLDVIPIFVKAVWKRDHFRRLHLMLWAAGGGRSVTKRRTTIDYILIGDWCVDSIRWSSKYVKVQGADPARTANQNHPNRGRCSDSLPWVERISSDAWTDQNTLT